MKVYSEITCSKIVFKDITFCYIQQYYITSGTMYDKNFWIDNNLSIALHSTH